MAQNEVDQLKAKLKSQQEEFQNYKTSAKQFEQLLQQQQKQKQQQITKLTQQSIKNKSTLTLLKKQVTQLQSENTNLKTQLNQLKSKNNGQEKQQQLTLQQNKKHIQQLQNNYNQLVKQHQTLKQKISISQQEYQKKTQQLQQTIKKLQQQLQSSQTKIQQLQNESKKQQSIQPSKKNSQSKQHKIEQKKIQKSNENTGQQQKLKKKLQKQSKKLSQLQTQNKKLSTINHQQHQTINQLTQQLQNKNKQLYSSSVKKNHFKQDKDQHQSTIKQQTKHFSSQTVQSSGTLLISAIIMTKKHYSSPFLQLKHGNLIKMLKSTKNGCFQKSMGSTKYKLNTISYDAQQLLQSCAQQIKQNIKNNIKNSIIFYGHKKSTKKYLMSNLLSKLKQFILEIVNSSQHQIQSTYINTSSQPQKKIQKHITNKQQIQQLINFVIDIAQKSQKKPNELKKKNTTKPKIRYFKIVQGQLDLEIITTSFTNIPLRQCLSPSDALNNIVYSRLPNALQPLDCHRQIILTLNPIVSLYQQCKNMLTLANCKKQSSVQQPVFIDQRKQGSPIKQQLNDTVRKKLQSIQRQNEQNSLKIKKQQQQINYYKNKFDQLQIRLKNLLNTHRQQNTYLKKSPVTLSYEKMLKFVHSAQAKNNFNSKIQTEKFQDDHPDTGERGGSEQDIL